MLVSRDYSTSTEGYVILADGRMSTCSRLMIMRGRVVLL